jgi:hypothetical protein
MKAEEKVHNGNVKEIVLCVKENVGTNHTAKELLKFLGKSGPIVSLPNFGSKAGDQLQWGWEVFQLIGKSAMSIVFYYLDLAKDCAVAYFSTKILSDSLSSFYTFGSQVEIVQKRFFIYDGLDK